MNVCTTIFYQCVQFRSSSGVVYRKQKPAYIIQVKDAYKDYMELFRNKIQRSRFKVGTLNKKRKNKYKKHLY